MNLDQEFHSFGVSETLRRQAVLVHNHRTGMALDVLERNQSLETRLVMLSIYLMMASYRRMIPGRPVQVNPEILANKTKALIEHDRILRGEA